MVTGLNIFRDYFTDDTDKYVLIGGAAWCIVQLEKNLNSNTRAGGFCK